MDSEGRTIWIVDAHRDDGKRFVVRADEKLMAFVELEAVIHKYARQSRAGAFQIGTPKLMKALCFVLVLASAILPVSDLRAEQIRFPPAPTDAISAEETFDQRATIVTRFNACGREIDYARLRREQSEGNYENQGEGLTQILIAKIAWLTDPRYANQPCEYELKVPRPKNPDGSFVNLTEEGRKAFLTATLGFWIDPDTPTQCSSNTSRYEFSEKELVIKFHAEPECMRRQVNEAILAMVRNKQMGSDGLPCIGNVTRPWEFQPTTDPSTWIVNKGDWDVNVRELVRILYMGTIWHSEVLDRSTIDYMYKNLLTARGGLSDSSYSVITDCDDPAGDELGSPEEFADREYWYNELLDGIADAFKWLSELPIKIAGFAGATLAGTVGAPFVMELGGDPAELVFATDVRAPETENHRLMIETSKYLTNAKILAELRQMKHDNVDEIQKKQDEVRDWLLHRLQSITINDFDEYNSRAYTRYSLNAILNLHDFADSDDLRTASRIVLDRAGAKFAAASNRGRRVVPFRRLAKYDSVPLYEAIEGADHEVARAVVLAGQTQLLEGGIIDGVVKNMVWAAVSPYRWPRAVLEVAIERRWPIEQDILHAGVEGYYSSPAFTMSLGGVRTPAALNMVGFDNTDDRGVAMPTVIIPTTAGKTMEEVFAFDGNDSHEKRTFNTCGWQGFVCGIQPHLSPVYDSCKTGLLYGSYWLTYSFINSAACPAASSGPHFYLASKTAMCDGTFCEEGRFWGLMEVVEAPGAQPTTDDPAFQAFKEDRKAALQAAVPDANGSCTYFTKSGHSIHFVVNDSGSFIADVDSQPRPAFATRGDVINSKGDGKVTITSPWSSAKVLIDYTKWNMPQRQEIK